MGEVQEFLRRSRAQVDRYRKRQDFPKPMRFTESMRGSLLFMRHEIHDWAKNQRR